VASSHGKIMVLVFTGCKFTLFYITNEEVEDLLYNVTR
jgi:hypothetical protein